MDNLRGNVKQHGQRDTSRLTRREFLAGATVVAGAAMVPPWMSSIAMPANVLPELVSLNALELSQKIKAKQVSCVEVMQAYLALDAYPEAPAALLQLRDAGMATAILSNGTPAMLAAIIDHAGLTAFFDAVLSVEETGLYKPHSKVYQLACDRLGLAADAILFVSSNGWDAWSASAFGFRVAWCNRNGLAHERLPGAPDHEIRSLAELPALLTPSHAS